MEYRIYYREHKSNVMHYAVARTIEQASSLYRQHIRSGYDRVELVEYDVSVLPNTSPFTKIREFKKTGIEYAQRKCEILDAI